MKKNSIKNNFLMNALLTLSSFVFPLITYPYVSRVLHPAGIGKVSFAISILSYFNILAQLGIPTYGIRACSKVRDNKIELTRTAQELLNINVLMSMITYVLLTIFVGFIDELNNNKVLIFAMSVSIILNAIGMEWFYRALEKYTYITVRSLVFKILALTLMFIMIKDSYDYVWYGIITIFAASASNIMNFIHIRKYVNLFCRLKHNYKRHIKPIFIFFAMTCATTVYTNLDTVMLGFMTSDEQVGYYNTAVKIKMVLVCIITSLGTVLLPRASYYIHNNMVKEFQDIIAKTLSFVVYASVPMSLFFLRYSEETIWFVAGTSFAQSVNPMKIIIFTIPFIGISSLLGYEVLVPEGKEKVFMYAVLLGAVTDLILNFIWIPLFGVEGAALATLIAEIMVAGVVLINLWKQLKSVYSSVSYIKIGLSCVLSFTILSFLHIFQGNAILSIIIGGTIFWSSYFGITLLLKEKNAIYIGKLFMKYLGNFKIKINKNFPHQ